MTFRDKQTGQSQLSTLQAVELALNVNAKGEEISRFRDRVEAQERMIAELVAVLHESGKLTNADVLRLIGKFRFEVA
jgi:hypothetical protein